MANYSITIEMDQPTVEKLQKGGYSLYAFKAVETGIQGGQPLVWFKTQAYGLTMSVTWQQQYFAYTSKQEIKNGAIIKAANRYKIDLSQTLDVTNPAGTGQVVNGFPKVIGINNKTDKEFTCGIGTRKNDVFQDPLCAFPLYGYNINTMIPIEKVALMFATNAVDTGTVVERSFTSGVLLDLTGKNDATITYNINGSWNNSTVLSEVIPADAVMANYLITHNESLAKLLKA